MNPYSSPPPPAKRSLVGQPQFHRGPERGPAIYVVLCAVLFGLGVPPLLNDRNVLGLILPTAGCLVGGLLYRYRSRKWPIDRTVRTKQSKYLFLPLLLPPVLMAVVTGLRGQWRGIIIIIIFLVLASFGVGMLLAGQRRDGVFQPERS